MADTISPYGLNQNAYDQAFTQTYLADEQYELFNLAMPDDRLHKLLVDSLDEDVSYWNQSPWNLQQTDLENVKFLLGEQLNEAEYLQTDARYKDNRLFSSTRAILSYVTGQLAVPELTPSRGDDIYLKGARDLQMALYQHSLDENVEQKVRAAVLNLITRKRGYLKQRFDPNVGMYGDIVTEVCNPEDIIIDRYAGYLTNPLKIYHRIRCTVDELIARFPNKASEIKTVFSIKQGRFTQMAKFITYFECWFTYMDAGKPKEGVCWFVPNSDLILDKMPNPNWIYSGDDKKDKQVNVCAYPPKPFVWFNYMNLGHSFIDETCLFDQAKPLQQMLNRRGRQIWENADFVNGRWLASKKSFSQADAYKLVNKGARTVAMVESEDVSKALVNVASPELPVYVYNTLLDTRNEIDVMMGTPSQFRGASPDRQDTLGRDLMVKQQAGMLQDDLVKCVAQGMEQYYKLKLQLMRTYYSDDYWFQCKGADGKYDFIMLNGDNIDSNVKIGVQTDSTLPLDKQQVRATALELWRAGQSIDYKTFMEDLGLPNPDIRTERYLRSKIDPITYLESVVATQLDSDVESDIMLLIANKVPEERDNYSKEYLDYFNGYMASNRFAKLQGSDPKAAQRIMAFLMAVQHIANESANLQEAVTPPLDAAGILDQPITPPVPKRDVRIVVPGTPLDAQQTSQISGAPPAASPTQAPAPPATTLSK